MSKLKSIQIVPAPGTYKASNGMSVSFSQTDLAATAAAYDTSKHRAPIVIGHPKVDDPAYGWLASAEENGDLRATPEQVNADFAEMYKTGAFANHSASFYGPNDSRNPVPGVWYLKHVGFLGAVPPGIPGLDKVEFADDVELITFEFSEASPGQPTSTENDDMSDKTAGLADREAKLNTAQSELDKSREQLDADKTAFQKQQADFSQSQAKAHREDVVSYVDGLIEKGMKPKHKDSLVEFMAGIQAGTEIEFNQEGSVVKKSAANFLREFISELVTDSGGAADFSEIATKGHAPKSNNPLLADAESRSKAEA